MPPCRFHNSPSGCRHGDKCTYSHTQQAGPSSRGPETQVPLVRAPPGTCNFFWTSGKCKREFNCKFKHERKQSTTEDTPSPEAAPPQTWRNRPSTSNNSSSKDLAPYELHGHLKRFLHDDFRFPNTSHVYAFVSLLASINTSGPLWAPEDGPLLLTTLAKDNGLLRINDVLRWTSVSTEAGSNSVLSFQRGLVPLLKFYASDLITKSTLEHLVNALYMRILENFDQWSTNLRESMRDVIEAQSFRDTSTTNGAPTGIQVLTSLRTIFYEILTRFKNVSASYPKLPETVRDFHSWSEAWIQGVTMSPPSFEDPYKDIPSSTRDHILQRLRSDIQRVVTIVDREQGRNMDRTQRSSLSSPKHRSQEGLAAALRIAFDTEGPGELRASGRRHDNDFVDITDIEVAPTHEELISSLQPFLPGNFYDAPHHLPAESMERLLDVQFRLLREELTASLRSAVQLVRNDLMRNSPQTTLSKLMTSRGGKYRGQTDGSEQVMFNLYTNVAFVSMPPDRRGLSVQISFDTPPGRARQSSAKSRVAFWEGVSGKRLIQGGLVALLWQSGADIHVYLATVASNQKELGESAGRGGGDERVAIRLAFFSPDVELRVLNALKNRDLAESGTKLLIEAPVMFEAIRPFLEALRREPESLPFAAYLVHRPHDYFVSRPINAPQYALVPGFKFELASLFPPEAGITTLELDVSDPISVASAREQLRTPASRLDPSQADAVVDTLTREVALIQGPPGTGKSFTGVEILRVLLANKIQPILMIAFTNHALDHLLSSVLDAGITQKIVRLGSRSVDERISQYSLETLEFAAGKNSRRLQDWSRSDFYSLKEVQKEIDTLMKAYVSSDVPSEEVKKHLQFEYPEHYDHLYLCPPGWIQELLTREADDEQGGGWETVDKHGKAQSGDGSVYAFWRSGRDLDYINDVSQLRQSQAEAEAEKQSSQNRYNILNEIAAHEEPKRHEDSGVEDDSDSDDEDVVEEAWQREWRALPDAASLSGPDPATESDEILQDNNRDLNPGSQTEPYTAPSTPTQFPTMPSTVPKSDRALPILLEEGTMWIFSRKERNRLHEFWSHEIRDSLNESQLAQFESLRRRYSSILKRNQESQDEIRRSLLTSVDIVGCTTTGAAKLTSLLKSLSPRVMLIEEAGQVLEAHVLGSLVPSIEHLVLIGDPLQLRPTLNTYSLSMDSKRGKALFKFDMSLMERLSSNNNLPMSQINVQRRMRPEISSLIRQSLYPSLEDHKLVKSYPNVRGFSKNVFFFDHSHRENDGGDESASKYNTFEVQMIKDLVLHLLRQGCYSDEADIVVLCAYLGQLARVRDVLGSLNEIAVLIDGKDKQDLAEQEEELEDQGHIEHVKVTKRVRLRTIDNYQGEEAKIVILSTVRNAGSHGDGSDSQMSGRPTIGFLASENRTNVALSRAKEGMFILGNAAQLSSRSKMWREVIEQLDSTDMVGPAFPVSCYRHPDTIHLVSEPGKISLFAPDGGCLEPCSSRLKCGHMCQYKCHPDDPKHIAVTCSKPCPRLCPRMHPCDKECSQDCGSCRFLVRNVLLPCGHRAPAVECWRLDNLEDVRCTVVEIKHFSDCEHTAPIECTMDPSEVACASPCDGIMSCCGRTCTAKCRECQTVNDKVPGQVIVRKEHQRHLCQKVLFCGHFCSKPCSANHQCVESCQAQCRQACSHSQCKDYCSSPCSPCMKDCTWACSHRGRCPLPCGSVCSRLPCDVPCSKTLRCGHRCPSVCGEDCAIQVCVECAPTSQKQDVVDLVMFRTLGDIDPSTGTLSDLLITLKKCGHVFTVETLDGHCRMLDFYTQNDDETWRGLCSPETGSETRAPPACPTCRQAITSPRYGRIFKSADLDILERNVISTMTRRLDKLQTSMNAVSKDNLADALSRESAKLVLPTPSASESEKQRKKRAKERSTALLAHDSKELPVALENLIPSAALHDVSSKIADTWKRATQRVTNLYGEAMRVAAMRSAHMNAWEAAFASLFRQEIDRAAADPAHAPRHPAEHAMRIAKLQVGQVQPLADRRFVVEAFWATLRLRFVIGDLARTWVPQLMAGAKNLSKQEGQKWGSFGLFVLDSCVHDAELAFSIAKKSESRRQMTTSRLLQMRADFERFRFNVDMARASDTFQSGRARFLEDVKEAARGAGDVLKFTQKEHLKKLSQDRTWLVDNFSTAAEAILAEWGNMEQSIRQQTFYQSVSLDEKMNVVRALNFSHTGHFYTCPQGHVYVITECGGAMQTSVCPECGSTIGGRSHQLDAQNMPAAEFEAMAREAGSVNSPWAWGQIVV
ncbi:hypothetical protein C8F01DRAFT_1044463 [Mycena amicta]|nr:hypothetical protein C8F01DRAFT_1044463 [Mycena amicta]